MRLSVHDVLTRGAVSDGLCVGSAALLTCCGCHSAIPALSFAAVKPIITTTLLRLYPVIYAESIGISDADTEIHEYIIQMSSCLVFAQNIGVFSSKKSENVKLDDLFR